MCSAATIFEISIRRSEVRLRFDSAAAATSCRRETKTGLRSLASQKPLLEPPPKKKAWSTRACYASVCLESCQPTTFWQRRPFRFRGYVERLLACYLGQQSRRGGCSTTGGSCRISIISTTTKGSCPRQFSVLVSAECGGLRAGGGREYGAL